MAAALWCDFCDVCFTQMTYHLNSKVERLLYNLLRCDPEVRHKLLDWLGACLDANAGEVPPPIHIGCGLPCKKQDTEKVNLL